MHKAMLAAVCLILTPASAFAQTATDHPLIVVAGAGLVERPAEWVFLSATVRGEGKTQADAINALNAAQARVRAGLSRLAGVTSVGFESGEISIHEVRGPDCATGDSITERAVLSQGACAVEGVVATAVLRIKLAPADKVGPATAYASELGAVDVDVLGSGRADEGTLREEAMRQAFASAERQARAMAAAAGGRLGPVVRIQDSEASADPFDSSPDLRITYSDAALSVRLVAPPTTTLELTAPDVTASARVTVVYRLEK